MYSRQTMRLFLALNLLKKEKDRIYHAARPLRESKFPVRWVEPSRFHITLRFLGDVPEGRIESVEAAVGRVAATTAPLDLSLEGFGAFPMVRRPRVIWVGVVASPAIRRLRENLQGVLTDYGFERETRVFHPHVTLGRAAVHNRAGAFRGLGEIVAGLTYKGHVAVRKLDLMRSHLSEAGARYTVHRSARLGG